MTPTVAYSRRRGVLVAGVVLAIGAGWTARHAVAIARNEPVSPVFAFMAGSFVFFLVLAWLERPKTATAEQRAALDELTVTVNVPLYNEDPAIVRQVLDNLLVQTRKPNRVQVVDDGSTQSYGELVSWWPAEARAAGIDGAWTRVANGGKRHAQLVTFRHDDGDIFVTVDSDSVLAADAIEQGLLPFADPKVTSVAAVVLAMNAKTNVVTRLTDLMFANFQLITRSGLSRLGSVLVNSGCLAFYRAQVVRDAIPSYEAERFGRRNVQFSDNSFLTLAAHLAGKTVQQPTSVAFTWLPEKTGHHFRQQLRWFRGSTIRSIWRFRYLPFTRASYFVHLLNWINFALVGVAFGYLAVVQPVVDGAAIPWFLAASCLVAYATSLKYLTVKRSDISLACQLATFLMTPLLVVWSALVLRPLRLYAMATCWKTGSWGTRTGGVEVKALEAA
jgi:hyaluronan synthase